MGNLLSFEIMSTNPDPIHHYERKQQSLSSILMKPLELPIWKTKVKASFRISDVIKIIEILGEQDEPELREDIVHLHGVLQMTCAK